MPDTITIQPWTICLVIALISTPVIIASLKGHFQRRNEKRQQEAEKQKQEEKQEERQQREELVKLLPEPWLKGYDECQAVGSYWVRLIWLKAWLEHTVVLPKISISAAKLFAEMVGGSWHNLNFEKALTMLTPCFELPALKQDEDAVRREGGSHHTVKAIRERRENAVCLECIFLGSSNCIVCKNRPPT